MSTTIFKMWGHCNLCCKRLRFIRSQSSSHLHAVKTKSSSNKSQVINGQRRSKVTSSTSAGGDKQIISPELTRNVGIMAHIDAGKTTTTERFLYYSGMIATPGEVHHGDTVTDFLPQERERGITIQSAVVSFPWRGHQINLIDTPGHVDFTFEVQRSLRVVDSAVAIIDASAGVEAQTLTVWRQATDYQLPRLIFLNKMDKGAASVEKSLESIRSKLKCVPLLLQQPVFDDKSKITGERSSGLSGVIDLIHMQQLVFDSMTKGSKVTAHNVNGNVEIMRSRCELVEQVADVDSLLAAKIIENESIESVTPLELSQALKRATLNNSAVPVLLGSSYKYVGVQPLIDSIIRYLPHPQELLQRDHVISAYGTELCCFAFKTVHDPQLGPLTFLRLCSGSLQTGQKLYNVTRGKQEKLGKIYIPLAEDLSEIKEAIVGQVVIVSGLKDTVTGDTLSVSHSVSSIVEKKLRKKISSDDPGKKEVKAVLSGVEIPDPVFFCSIEPPSISQQKALDAALECLQREDPSLHVHVDPDTSQTVLSGMGELHLDIIQSRLKSEFKVEADLGKIQVAYKETIASPHNKRIHFERTLAEQRHSVNIELCLSPTTDSTSGSKVKLYHGRNKDKCENLAPLSDKFLKNIQNGVDASMRFGPKLSFPVINVDVTLHWFESSRGTSETIIEAAAASCFRQCLQEATIYLLEPVVNLEITVDERYQRIVLDDLNRRRFVLSSIDLRHGNHIITGTAPLSDLLGYSTILRTISSGLGTFSMHFSHHQVVNNPIQEQKIVSTVRGF